jgi:hypothetical protein
VRAVAVESHLLRITCGRCDATWAGADRAHCAVCHRTFDDATVWDGHRLDGTYAHPRQLGLIATKNGIWLELLARTTVEIASALQGVVVDLI